MRGEILAALLAAAILIAVAAPTILAADNDVVTVTLEFNPTVYPEKFWGKLWPAYAVWVVDDQSGESRTLYATGKLARQKWVMAKQRPAASPVWWRYFQRERERPGFDLDAVTAATPKDATHAIGWTVPPQWRGKKLTLYVEANVSFDYNRHHPENAKEGDAGYSGVNGQPSLVWRAAVTPGEPVALKLVGHGHVRGVDAAIDPDLSTVTTAKDIFKTLHASVATGNP